MKKAEVPYLADWFVISFRWFSLLGITIAFNTSGNLNWLVWAVLIFAAVWNVVMSVLAMTNFRLPNHRLLNITIDLTISLLLFKLVGGLYGSLTWCGILAILTASIYYEWKGSLITAFLISLAQFGISYFGGSSNDPRPLLIPIGLIFGFNVIAGLILGFGSKQLMKGLRKNYLGQMRQLKEMQMQAQKQERGRMKVFYQLIETLSSTLNYEVVLNSSLDLSQKIFNDLGNSANSMTSAVLLFEEGQLLVASARRFSPTDMKRKFPASKGALYDAIQSGEPQICSHPSQDEELKTILAMQANKQAVVVPLSRGLDTYGVMLFAHPQENFFTNEKIEFLDMLSHQAVIAIQNAILYQQLELEKEAIIESQEEAQKKLARDLHDGPTQSVSAIAMRLNIARKMLEMSPEKIGDELAQIEDLARKTTGEIRHMLFTLRPLVLESEGLQSALEAIANKTLTTYQQNVKIDADESVIKQLDQNKQTVLFYLAEEAVNNARKHAQANLIWVRLRRSPTDHEIAIMEVIDNGLGFDVEKVNGNYTQRGSLGMVNLKERSQLVNGLLHIDSVPGRGTRVQIYVPLTQSAVERIQHGVVELLQT